MTCVRCAAALPPPPYGRRDTCPGCGADLHACVQCLHFSPGLYNDCRESQADRVSDKERTNFCDWFQPAPGGTVPKSKEDPRAKLEALFRKK